MNQREAEIRKRIFSKWCHHKTLPEHSVHAFFSVTFARIFKIMLVRRVADSFLEEEKIRARWKHYVCAVEVIEPRET